MILNELIDFLMDVRKEHGGKLEVYLADRQNWVCIMPCDFEVIVNEDDASDGLYIS